MSDESANNFQCDGESAIAIDLEAESRDDPVEIDRALLSVIMSRGSQCLSQASLRTGFGIQALLKSKDRLLQRKLIRVRPGSERRDPIQVSYEFNV